jgi:hypothetical protein
MSFAIAVSMRLGILSIELAAMHERMGDPDGSTRQHTGLHGGPGGLGRCPVIHSGTTVRFTRIRKGAVIHVHALVPEDVARVQAIVAERLAYIAERLAYIAER